ncbi:sugar transferase [Ruminococcus flavefaciens]|uniref:sugar transferase n=1 Tax=Ruminococcus flavefaciens TaxID=1265 RepID=UPI0026EB1F39|nr:sugar transferase [Ruminococcus flavefaciens]
MLDFTLSLGAIIVLSPILLVLTIVGAVAMGGNPFFTQDRPGKNEKIFKLVKFRTMNNKKDKNGKLLPDDKRLTSYGKWLRSTSLDELPELFNIIKGDMSIIGPRPLLVRDMVFMTTEQRKRHTVAPGLTGLAQANGRNGISWDKKLKYDLMYIKRITFIKDLKIIIRTAYNVLKKDGITEDGMATAADLGDYLLYIGRISKEDYDKKQEEARKILNK